MDRRLLPRVLGPVEAFCVVVGSVIGSGIFLVPASVARDVPFVGGIILVWIIGGLFSAAGALTLAELGAMMPHAGGPYVYLRAAYGRLPAFLFGWAEFTVVRTGSMATLAAAFARYFAQLVPPPAAIDGRGLAGRRGGPRDRGRDRRQRPGHAPGRHAPGHRHGAQGRRRRHAHDACRSSSATGQPRNLAPLWPASLDRSLFTGMMAAMVGVLWAYDGWINVTPLAEEIRDPGRNIPRSLDPGHGHADRGLPGDDPGLPLRLADDRGRRGQQRAKGASRRPSPPSIARRCWAIAAWSRSRSWSCARPSSRSTATP